MTLMRTATRLTVLLLLITIAAACRGHAYETGAGGHSPAATWRMVVLPDTQSYCDNSNHMPILFEMTNWIVDNAEELKIALVLQEGDIVYQNNVPLASMSSGNQKSADQWANARRAFATLDGVVPYILVPGNHDYGVTNADTRFTYFNDYFTPQDNPLTDPQQGGILAEMGENFFGKQTLENAAYDFSAPDGRRFLIIGLEWGPRQAAVDWANSVAAKPQYSGHTLVLLTHAYEYHDDTRYDWETRAGEQHNNPHSYEGTKADTHDGEELWDELVSRYANFQLVFSGHVGGDQVGYHASEGRHGNTVHQFLFNAQFLPRGGEGWLRILEFMPDGQTVQVRTYSPYFDQDGDEATAAWRVGADDDFTFELAPDGSV